MILVEATLSILRLPPRCTCLRFLVSLHGGITRQGPAWLRWALITAAHAVTRSKSPLARRYWRLRRRKRPNVAKTAVAGSIARCVYGVLKHGGAYQEERWGRQTGDELKQEA